MVPAGSRYKITGVGRASFFGTPLHSPKTFRAPGAGGDEVDVGRINCSRRIQATDCDANANVKGGYEPRRLRNDPGSRETTARILEESSTRRPGCSSIAIGFITSSWGGGWGGIRFEYESGAFNLYESLRSNPFRYLDPLGLVAIAPSPPGGPIVLPQRPTPPWSPRPQPPAHSPTPPGSPSPPNIPPNLRPIPPSEWYTEPPFFSYNPIDENLALRQTFAKIEHIKGQDDRG